MSEKELEQRAMINEKQFLEIRNFIQENYSNYRSFSQTNIYFDDASFSIKKNHNVLRIRYFKNSPKKELTYKTKGEKCDIEYTLLLDEEIFNNIMKGFSVPEGEVKEQLIKDNIDISSLKPIIELSTDRIEVQFDDHLFVLDKNYYNNIIDYNIEIESTISKEHALRVLLDYCKKYHISYNGKCQTKSHRAFASIGLIY